MDVDSPLVGGPEPDPEPERPHPPRLTVVIAAGVVVGLLGLLFAVTGNTGEGSPGGLPEAGSSSTMGDVDTPASLGSTSATTSPSPTSSVTTAAAEGPEAAVEVDLLDGAQALLGDVALTPFPGASGGGTLWVLRAGGSVVQRTDVPFRPGDFPHPMIFTGGHIAFADLDNAYLVDADLQELPVAVAPASFVVPGSEPGQIWLVGQGVEWVAPLDVGAGTLGEQTDVSALFWWPLSGLGDGLLVAPIDEATYGSTAYWSPVEGLRPIAEVRDAQSGVHVVAGELAVVISPGLIRMVDLATGEEEARIRLELGEGLVSEVCISPGHEYVAVFGSTGQAFVADTRSGEVLHRLATVHGHNSVGWTADEQLAYIVDDGDTRIQTLDVATGAFHDIARLRSSRGWWLTASGTMC